MGILDIVELYLEGIARRRAFVAFEKEYTNFSIVLNLYGKIEIKSLHVTIDEEYLQEKFKDFYSIEITKLQTILMDKFNKLIEEV